MPLGQLFCEVRIVVVQVFTLGQTQDFLNYLLIQFIGRRSPPVTMGQRSRPCPSVTGYQTSRVP